MLATTPSKVAASLIQDGPTHRAGLARRLSVSRTAVTNAVDGLLAQGIAETEPRSTDAPTLKDKVRLSPRFGLAGAAVIDFDQTIVGIGTLDGRLLATRAVANDPSAHGSRLVGAAAQALRDLQDEHGEGAALLHTLLAVNTQADRRTGVVLGGTASAAWADTNPQRQLAEELGAPVHLENTARLLALAEQLDRPGVSDLAFVQLSYGVAMGLVVNGRILGGSRGGAGELGHMSIDLEGRECTCAGRGCLMQYIGREALDEEARTLLGPDAELPDLIREAADGDAAAVRLVEDLGRRCGIMLTAICNLLEPTTLVIGGSMREAGRTFMGPLRESLAHRALPLVTDALRIEAATGSLVPATVLRAALSCLRWDAEVRADVVSRSLVTTRTRRPQKAS